LDFLSLQRFRNRGSASRGPCGPATLRPQRFSRSRRFSPPGTSPGLFHPGNALGIRPSGSFPPEEPVPSRGPFLSCRSPERPAGEGGPPVLGSRGLLPPGIRTVEGFLGPIDGRYPLGLHPSRALPSPAVGSASRPLLSCASPPKAAKPWAAGASEFHRQRTRHFPLAQAPALLGFATSSLRLAFRSGVAFR